MKDYYGWRARIGLIYIADATVMEHEFATLAPDGVSVHTALMHLPAATLDGLTAMMRADALERATRQLAEAPLHVIVFGGTSASFLEGRGYDEAVCSRIEAISKGIAATTTSTAALRALRAVGAKRISFVSPYLEEVVARGRRFFEENGFEVLSADGLGLENDRAMEALKTEQVYNYARDVAHPDADAVFLSCTGWRTIGALAPLEEDLGVPVVSANQASFWDCLRIARVGAPIKGFGRLLELERRTPKTREVFQPETST